MWVDRVANQSETTLTFKTELNTDNKVNESNIHKESSSNTIEVQLNTYDCWAQKVARKIK